MNKICTLYGEKNLIMQVSSNYENLVGIPLKIMLEEYQTEKFKTEIQILPKKEYDKNKHIDYFKNVTGFDRRNIYHDVHKIYGYPYENLFPKRTPTEKDYVAIWHSKYNLEDPQEWKNPIGYKGIINYVESLNQEIKYVDYTMNLRYIIDIIANAKLCIGYEGMGQLISQSFMKPIITFSTQEYISLYNSGPWGLVVDKIYDHMFDVDNIIGTQNEKIDKYRSCSN